VIGSLSSTPSTSNENQKCLWRNDSGIFCVSQLHD
jgi:hypothetical protein